MKITDLAEIESIIRRASVCRLALAYENQPYVVPLFFGYERSRLYFHSGRKGKKLELIRKNDRVCFQMDVDVEIIKADIPCNWDVKYASVIGYGRAAFVENADSKRHAFDVIMQQYSDETYHFSTKDMAAATIIEVAIETITGKKSN
jgi:nitroimidazol reductase NimA-like FMN-containing flavoprotein (pyridoxamine 5'-phosphate oxidase superfamily)